MWEPDDLFDAMNEDKNKEYQVKIDKLNFSLKKLTTEVTEKNEELKGKNSYIKELISKIDSLENQITSIKKFKSNPSSSIQLCASCRYFANGNECRRHPMTYNIDMGEYSFTYTHADLWCGEYIKYEQINHDKIKDIA